MSFWDKLFPRKGEKESFKEEDEARDRAEAEKKKEKERIARERQEEEDYLSLNDFDFKHPVKSMRLHMRLVKEGIYKGDKRAWHQFLMVTIITLAGFCIIMTLCINFCLELINLRVMFDDSHAEKIIQQGKTSFYVQEGLPAGEYGMVNIFQSSSFHSGEETGNNTVVVVANLKGGALLAAPVPDETEIPSEWFGADSYNLVVDEEGKWSFKQSEVFEKHKETVAKAQREYMERMAGKKPSDQQPPVPEAEVSP